MEYKVNLSLVFVLLFIGSVFSSETALADEAVLADNKAKIVFISGMPSHGPMKHEHRAGNMILADALNRSGLNVETVLVPHPGYPKDTSILQDAATIVIFCTGHEGHVLNPHLDEFDELMKSGTGVVMIHWATEAEKGKPGEKFLEWMGGFCDLDWSVNPHWSPRFQDLPAHPITNGVHEFSVNDEWYYHMRFVKDMQGVTPILSDLPPPETLRRADGPRSGNPAVRKAVANGQRQHVAWAYDRPAGGRGFGFTGAHNHVSWQDENFRKVVLNAILWTAHVEVPHDGCPSPAVSNSRLKENIDDKKPRKKKAAPQVHATPKKTTVEKPNIVVILADDLGYGSVGCYGATKVRTPNIDRIAQEGIRFTDANTPSSVCTPTRYGLLMGEYPWRNPQVGLRTHPEPLLLPANQQNVASLLKEEGYATGCVGKWHLGFGEEKVDWRNSLTPGPLERGFEYYFGFPVNLNNEPVVYIEDPQLIHPEDPLDRNGRSGAKKSRVSFDTMTDVITGKAVSFIEKNKGQPFFLYYATHQVHVPIHPAPRFEGTSEAGIYGDYIQDCDWSVGQILDTLDRLELSENTLVFFTSDNGAIGWPANYKGERTGGEDGDFGFFRNAPWSGFKFGTEQGGSRVPFVARWPGKIKPGSESDSLISLVDFYATFRELLGQKDDGQGLDSVSFLGHLLPKRKNEATVRRSHIVYHAGKNSFLGIREKDWLLTFGGVPKQIISGKMGKRMSGKLYHLTNDPQETVDVYNQYPEVVNRIEQVMRKEIAKKESMLFVSDGQIVESESSNQQ